MFNETLLRFRWHRSRFAGHFGEDGHLVWGFLVHEHSTSVCSFGFVSEISVKFHIPISTALEPPLLVLFLGTYKFCCYYKWGFSENSVSSSCFRGINMLISDVGLISGHMVKCMLLLIISAYSVECFM